MTVHALKPAKVANLASEVSPEEWQARSISPPAIA